ncbi:unnamed protein product [Lactuca virosa]|uniref:Uncharacterized protein n=1 Tax=Lactuca virosa TaxID=75947 RepID=A0AAU9N235_9ASTR|nr:unnamed protein product [Lactuca virosa]
MVLNFDYQIIKDAKLKVQMPDLSKYPPNHRQPPCSLSLSLSHLPLAAHLRTLALSSLPFAGPITAHLLRPETFVHHTTPPPPSTLFLLSAGFGRTVRAAG